MPGMLAPSGVYKPNGLKPVKLGLGWMKSPLMAAT